MDQKEAQKRSREIIDSAEAFVLSTVNGNSPQSRVMGPKLIEEGMTIYMETYNDSRKVTQIKRNPRAQLLFMSEDKSEVVTLSGKATMDDSMSLKKRIWQEHPSSADYFTGCDDPRLGLIRFEPDKLEYIGPQTDTQAIEVTL